MVAAGELVGLLAGGTCRRTHAGALLGLGATLAALTGFYVLTGAVVDLNGQHFPLASIAWISANRVYYAAGVISGLLCGAAGAWWRARHRKGSTLPRRVVVLTGALLAAEPLALVVMGRSSRTVPCRPTTLLRWCACCCPCWGLGR